MKTTSRTRRPARLAKWACVAAALLLLMVWAAAPDYEFDISGGYSVRVKDGKLGVRAWGVPRAEYEKTLRESHGGPDTRELPFWILAAFFGAAAAGLWRWTHIPRDSREASRRPTCPTCHRELA